MNRRWVVWLWIIGAAVPAGALVFFPAEGRLLCFTLAILLETGHSLSPVALAWANYDFRREVVLMEVRKFIVLPLIAFGLAVSVGIVTNAGFTTYQLGMPHQMARLTWTTFLVPDLSNPFPILVWAYLIWNVYHFGMQNFGVLALSWSKMPRDIHRSAIKIGCVLLTAIGMYALPSYLQSWVVAMICIGAFSFNHWIVEIGLCSRASRHVWLFIATMLGFGVIGFLWMIPTSDAIMIRAIPVIIAVRMGVGFVHFLYDRWIWKLSNPLVRRAFVSALGTLVVLCVLAPSKSEASTYGHYTPIQAGGSPYSVQTVDVGGIITASGAGLASAILPACGSTGFAANSVIDFEDDGDGNFQIYVDPKVTGVGSIFLGSWKGSNVILLGPTGGARIWCDGKQWHAVEI